VDVEKIRSYYEEIVKIEQIPSSKKPMQDVARLMLSVLPDIEEYCITHKLTAFLSIGTLCISVPSNDDIVCIYISGSKNYKIVLERGGKNINETICTSATIVDTLSQYLFP
jgi:hypothetical protein